MDATRHITINRALDRAEELRQQVANFAASAEGRAERLVALVADINSWAAHLSVGPLPGPPNVDVANESQREILERLLSYLISQMALLRLALRDESDPPRRRL